MGTSHEHGDPRLDGVRAVGEQLLRLQRRRRTQVPGTRLEASAFRILWVLSDGTARTMRELGQALDLEQSTVNRQVHAALDAGLVERHDGPGRAGKLVRPTAAGAADLDHDAHLRAELIARALDALGPQRAARMVEDLTDFVDAWEAAGG